MSPGLGLVAGDLNLSLAEEELSGQWSAYMGGDPRAFRLLSGLWRILMAAGEQVGADLALIDVGPNLGALNRAALVAAQDVVVPLAPDIYSLQGLRNLGPTLRRWRDEWQERLGRRPETFADRDLPVDAMRPAGYVVLQQAVWLNRPVQAYDRWMERIPGEYHRSVLSEAGPRGASLDDDPHCLAVLKPYRSLMPLAQEALKPMFFLRPADGAIGSHAAAVQDCYFNFRDHARQIANGCSVSLP